MSPQLPHTCVQQHHAFRILASDAPVGRTLTAQGLLRPAVDTFPTIQYLWDSVSEGETAPYVSDSVKSIAQDTTENVGPDSLASSNSD